MNETESIREFSKKYFFLSNFYPCKVEYMAMRFPSSEHAYQAAKAYDEKDRLKISKLKTPREAKWAGKKILLRPNWESAKISVMSNIVACKFIQNGSLRKKLLMTEDAILIEGNTWGDTFWGMCNGKGRNELGKILMKTRTALNHDLG